MGAQAHFIDLADQINQEMPKYFVGRAEEKLGGLKDKEFTSDIQGKVEAMYNKLIGISLK
jgi:UDP-N-acetyl-D-mannosaminuronate dehydrogenase